MSCVQHVAGRLRLKFPQLKNRPDLAGSVETASRQLDGVVIARINTVTGSLLIHYDAKEAKQEKFFTSIEHTNRQFGFGHSFIDSLSAHAPSSLAGAEKIVDQFVSP